MWNKQWPKPALILVTLGLLAWISPTKPIDPWNLFSLKKIVTLIFGLALAQGLGVWLISLFGEKIGSILTGFLGGLVSSTATTASLCRKVKDTTPNNAASDILTFLGATLAMLIEALAINIYGTTDFHWILLVLFSGPILATILLVFYYSRQANSKSRALPQMQLNILPIIKLASFIIGVLTLSKLLQRIFGNAGLAILTFFVSLFEIHGSIISNLQLHDSGAIDIRLLGTLIVISIVASYVSKLFLVFTLGADILKKNVVQSTVIIILSLAVSSIVFYVL